MTKKIMVVDNHFIIREGLKLIFESIDDFDVIYEANDGQQAINILKNKKPDLILLDIIMENIDGFGVMTYVNQYCPEIPVVVLTTVDTGENIKKMLSLGAKGYLLKDASTEVIANTVINAIQGNTILQNKITEIISNDELYETQNNQNIFNLNSTEVEILSAISQGSKIKAIALKLHLSERTIKNHLTVVYDKMNVSSGVEAIALAVRNHII